MTTLMRTFCKTSRKRLIRVFSPFPRRIRLSATCCASSLEDVAEESGNSTAKERLQREATEARERRLIPYMTFYVAQSFRNPNSGAVRQNVLIPIQAQPTNVERISGVSQIQGNNIQNAGSGQQRYEVPHATQPAAATGYTEGGFYPTPSIELTPKQLYKSRPEVLGQVYRFKSPGPQVQVQQQQQQRAQVARPSQQTHTRQRPGQKYPELVNIIPQSYEYVVTSPRPQYTSAKLQTLVDNPYLSPGDGAYYKRPIAENVYVPGKVYAINIVPKQAQKIAIQRLPPRPDKANRIFLGPTVPTPYAAKVKFELEDARVPALVDNVHIDPTPLPPATYVPEQISSNYIQEQSPITEPPRNDEHNVYYGDVPRERPSQVSFVPVHPQSVAAVQIEAKHPSSPSPSVDHIRIVQEATTPRSHVVNDVAPTPPPPPPPEAFANPEKLSVDNSVVNLLTILKDTNQLPQNFTPENIDKSIKTLALILQRLQNEKKYQSFAAAPKVRPQKPATTASGQEKANKYRNHPQQSGTSTPGRPGIDYPTYATIPQTQFDCAAQRYKGFFGDPDTNCQVWHYCDLNGGQASFLCPNGTIFSQVALTCDWWFNVKCASTSQLYVLNERLYKYILPFSPSFPEDYSGPLVDRYLAAKFKEMEAKSRLKALKALISTAKPDSSTSSTSGVEDISITTPEYKMET